MNITQRKIHKVKDWNQSHTGIMKYTLGNGSMLDEPRKKGYVVQKRHVEGGEKSQYFPNYEKALAYFYKDNF
jgi:hypothetical protein